MSTKKRPKLRLKKPDLILDSNVKLAKTEQDYIKEIEQLRDDIRAIEHRIQILKTKRKLYILENNNGKLCSTCNGIFEYQYGNTHSKYFFAICEDCKQTSMHRRWDWTDNPAEWPLNQLSS